VARGSQPTEPAIRPLHERQHVPGHPRTDRGRGDLSRIKTQIVQEAVAADPALALDIMLDSLAGQLLHGAHSFQMTLEVQAKTVATDVPNELMATSDVRPVEETMATRFASIPSGGRFETIRAMSQDDKMALLAGLVAMMVDGTVFAGGKHLR